MTWFGVRFGYFCSSRAAAPETIGAAIEVPPARIIWPLTTQVGHSVANTLPGASVDTMRAPGAWISGLAKPSWVTPRLDQVARLSSPSAWLRLVVEGADRDHVRVVARRVLDGVGVGAAVAGGGDDHEALEPGGLDGRVERVGLVGARASSTPATG